MKITFDDRVSKTYHPGYARTSKPDEITVHGTAGGANGKAIVDWMLGLKKIYDDPRLHAGKEWEVKRVAQYLRGIGQFHFIIDMDGKTTRLYDPSVWVYHSESSRHDSRTIGVELVNPYRKNAGKYTDEQYASLATLIEDMKRKYPIARVATHSYNAKTYSGVDKAVPCPGEGFDFRKLIERLGIAVSAAEYGLKVS